MPVDYSFGWKPSAPDHRDVYYTAPRSLAASLPSKVDLTEGWSNPVWNPIWSQGNIGSCGPHTACADVVFAALKQQNLSSCPMPSRLFTYYTTRMIMGTTNYDSGVDNRSLVKSLAQYGWCDETMWPYNTAKFRQTPPQECFQQAKSRRISQYLAVSQSLEDMQTCLAGGDPFIFGFSVYESIYSVESTGNIPYPKRSERMVGGHDVLVTGYDTQLGVFFIRNSWGPNWGRGGMGTIPMSYATNPNLASDFWTVRHSALPDVSPDPPTPPEPPQPPQPPTPSPHKGKITLDVDWAFRQVAVKEVI